MTSPAQQAAVRSYRAMSRRLQDDAKKADDSQRPLLARKCRYQASIAHRAAFAELHDPEVSR